MSKHHGVLSEETLARARAGVFEPGDTCYAGGYGGPLMVYLEPTRDRMSGWARLDSGIRGSRGLPRHLPGQPLHGERRVGPHGDPEIYVDGRGWQSAVNLALEHMRSMYGPAPDPPEPPEPPRRSGRRIVVR